MVVLKKKTTVMSSSLQALPSTQPTFTNKVNSNPYRSRKHKFFTYDKASAAH